MFNITDVPIGSIIKWDNDELYQTIGYSPSNLSLIAKIIKSNIPYRIGIKGYFSKAMLNSSCAIITNKKSKCPLCSQL